MLQCSIFAILLNFFHWNISMLVAILKICAKLTLSYSNSINDSCAGIYEQVLLSRLLSSTVQPARIPKTTSSHDENHFWLNSCSKAQVNIFKKVISLVDKRPKMEKTFFTRSVLKEMSEIESSAKTAGYKTFNEG